MAGVPRNARRDAASTSSRSGGDFSARPSDIVWHPTQGWSPEVFRRRPTPGYVIQHLQCRECAACKARAAGNDACLLFGNLGDPRKGGGKNAEMGHPSRRCDNALCQHIGMAQTGYALPLSICRHEVPGRSKCPRWEQKPSRSSIAQCLPIHDFLPAQAACIKPRKMGKLEPLGCWGLIALRQARK